MLNNTGFDLWADGYDKSSPTRTTATPLRATAP